MVCLLTIIIFNNIKPEFFLFPDFLNYGEKKNRYGYKSYLLNDDVFNKVGMFVD